MAINMRLTAAFGALVIAAVAICETARAQDSEFQIALARYERAAARRVRDNNTPKPPQADKPQPTWLDTVRAIAQGQTNPITSPADASPYVHWRQRRGPAYPGRFWPSFGRWAKELPATAWDDTKACATNPVALIGLAAAGAAGLALRTSDIDDNVSDNCKEHGSRLNKFWDNVGDVGGNPGAHFAVAGAMFLTAMARNDNVNYEKSRTLLNALAINGLTTLVLKGIFRTRSPNGDPLGWPSGHTSSSFCFATVMYEEYGPWVGVPLFVFAGFVGYERVDARNHDFSDVISGALIGIAIGHAVVQNNKHKFFGMDVVPMVTPRGTVGLALTKRW